MIGVHRGPATRGNPREASSPPRLVLVGDVGTPRPWATSLTADNFPPQSGLATMRDNTRPFGWYGFRRPSPMTSHDVSKEAEVGPKLISTIVVIGASLGAAHAASA